MNHWHWLQFGLGVEEIVHAARLGTLIRHHWIAARSVVVPLTRVLKWRCPPCAQEVVAEGRFEDS